MIAVEERPKGMPAVDRMTLDQARSEVLRLAGNADAYKKQRDDLLAVLEKIAFETVATWVSDAARAAIAKVRS
jgi:hypothetical protein